MAPPPAPPPSSEGAMVTGATDLMLAPVLPNGFSATLVLMGGAAVPLQMVQK